MWLIAVNTLGCYSCLLLPTSSILGDHDDTLAISSRLNTHGLLVHQAIVAERVLAAQVVGLLS